MLSGVYKSILVFEERKIRDKTNSKLIIGQLLMCHEVK